jgi:hypothetical protein
MNTDEFFAEAKRLNLRMLGTPEENRAALDLKDAEIARLTAALKQANDQAEHFERLWYLTNEDAGRYAYAKTLEGQVVTMETFKSRGAAELDQALDDAMAEEDAAHGGEPQSAVAAAYGGLTQTAQG